MSPFAQLFSLGLVWVTFHCAGMCGPIVIGFDIAGATRGVSTLRGANVRSRNHHGNVESYQVWFQRRVAPASRSKFADT